MSTLVHLPSILRIAALTLVVFLPTLGNEFVSWDDWPNFVENPHYRGLGWGEVQWMFTTFHGGHYQPLSWLTLGLDYTLWKLNPFGYHLSNLLIHIANAVIFYFLAHCLLKIVLQRTSLSATAMRMGAELAALLFAIHPLRVESVAWVTERRDVLSAFFLLITLLLYLKSVQASGKNRRYLLASLWAYALSLLAKAGGAMLPPILLVLDLYPLRRLSCHPRTWLQPPQRRVWMEKLPFFLLAVTIGAAALAAQKSAGALTSLKGLGFLDRLMQAAYGLIFYLGKTLVPLHLAALYERPAPFEPWRPEYVVSLVLVVAITVTLFWARHRLPGALAAWTCYVILLLPVSGIFQSGPQIAADRYTYLSCLPWSLSAGALLALGWRRFSGHPQKKALSTVATVLLCGLVGVLGLLTWRQTGVWKNSDSLWTQVLKVEPHSVFGRNSYANALLRQGELDRAIGYYRSIIRDRPSFDKAHVNLGIALTLQGKRQEAMDHYRQALRYEPNNPKTHYNLADLLLREGALDAALEHFRTAIELEPTFLKAHTAFSGILYQTGRFAEAAGSLRRALSQVPNAPPLMLSLAWVLATCPDDSVRDGTEAIRWAEEAMRLGAPRTGESYDILAAAYAEAGRYSEALQTARLGIEQARSSGQGVVAEKIEQRYQLYKSGRPYHHRNHKDTTQEIKN